MGYTILTGQPDSHNSGTIKHTPRAYLLGVVFAFAIYVVLASVAGWLAPQAQAATAKTLNFQARLLSSTGAIVPDGNYNIEFKLYDASTSAGSSQGSCTGDANCLWTETRYDSNGVTAGNDNRVEVKAGYVSVYLGDITDLPSNIWNKQLWLTMNIGGSTQTATPTYDGEMTPRLRLTAVPAAYSLTNYNTATGFSSSLTIAGATGGDQSFVIPDQGAAGTYSLLTTAAASGSYVQFAPNTAQTDSTTNNSIFINKTGASGNILQLQKSAATVLTVGNNGSVDFQNSSDSATAYVFRKSNGTGVFVIDTSAQQIGTLSTTGATNSQNLIIRTGSASGTGSTGDITLRSGTATSGNSGNVSIEAGGATGTFGTISIGSAFRTGGINIGSTGTTAIVSSVNIGNSTAAGQAQTVSIGSSSNAGSTTTILGTALGLNNSGTGATTVGNSGATLTLQGNASTTLVANSGANSITVGFATPTAARTYTIPDSSASTDTFCLQTLANCSGSGTTLQGAYDADVNGGDTIIALTANDDSLIFRNPAASGSDSTYILTLDQLATGAFGGLSIQSAGTSNLLLVTDTTATARDVLTIADGGITTFRTQTDNTGAFLVQNAAGTINALRVDTSTSNGRVGIGLAAATAPSFDLSLGVIAGATTARTFGVETQSSANIGGNGLTVSAGTANGTGTGGLLTLQGGAASSTAGSAGGGVTISGRAGTTTGTGAAGGALTLQGGTAGGTGSFVGGAIAITAGASSSNGTGTAGAVTITGGAGQNGSTGGNVTITTGSSSSTTGSVTISTASGTGANSAQAGNINLTGGNGGTLSAGGNGGNINLTGGNSGGTTSAGGSINLTAGNASSSTSTAGALQFAAGNGIASSVVGGAVTINAGAGGTAAAGGAISLQGGVGGGGAGGVGGNVSLVGGGASGANAGGTATLQGGSPSATAGSNGGGVNITGAIGTTVGAGGAGGTVVIVGGNAGGTGANAGGSINLTAGTNASGGTGAAGTVTISGGTSTNSNAGGLLTLQGGAAAAVAGSAGGGVAITGRNGSSTTTGGIGGSLTFTAGNAGGSGNNAGGTITLQAGSATGSGTVGKVLVKNASDSAAAFQIQNAAGTTTVLNVATTSTTNAVAITTGATDNVGLLIQGVASQSEDLLNVRNSSNTKLFTIKSDGATMIGTDPGGTNTLAIRNGSFSGSNIALLVRAHGSQSVDLIQLQDSSSNINASFSSSGNQLTLGRIAAAGTVTQGKLVLADGTTDNFGLTLQSSTLTASRTYSFPDSPGNATDTVCLLTLANCAGGGGGSSTLQGAYDADVDGSDAIIALTTADDSIILRNPAASGSDSTYILTLDQLATGAFGGLSIQSAGTGNLLLITDTTATARDVLTIADTGITTFRNQTDSTGAFLVQNAGGTTNALRVDTTNGRIGINLAVATAPTSDIFFGKGAARTISVEGQSTPIAGNALSITAGAAGSSGAGGALTLQGGASTGSTGGAVNINGGAGSGASSGGGSINITAGDGLQSAGSVTISAGSATSSTNSGGSLTLQAGAAGATAGSAGGIVTLSARDGSATGTGGNGGTLSISSGSGQGSSSRNGGNISITAGGSTVAGTPGSVTITAGSAGASNATTGGAITLNAGFAGAAAGSSGGAVNISARNGSSTGAGGNGGAVFITAGNGGGTGPTNGANINLQAGSAGGAGTAGKVLVKNASNTTAAFQVQNTAGTVNVLTVDTSASQVLLGTSSSTVGKLALANATNANVVTITTAVQATGSFTATIPSLGADDTFCFVTLNNCAGGGGGSSTLQASYDADVDGSDAIIALTSADDSIVFRNPAAGGSDSTYVLTIDQLATGAKGGLDIQSAGTGALLRVRDTTATAADVLTIADGGAATFRTQTNSATAFRIQDASAITLLNADTIGRIIAPTGVSPAYSTLTRTSTSVDTGNDIGVGSSIAIGTDGLPIMSYVDVSIGDIRTTHCGNSQCSSGNTSTATDASFVYTGTTSLAIGVDGLPVISAFDSTNSNAVVIRCADIACNFAASTTTIDSANVVGLYSSIAIGTDGLPIVSFYDSTNGDLRVTKCGNVGCTSGNTTTAVDTAGNGNGQYTSIAIGTDGLPIISYYDGTAANLDLRVTKCGNAACSSGNTSTTIDSTNNVGAYTSIAIGTDGLPIISHYDTTNGDLRVTKCGNASCTSGNTSTTVDSTNNVGLYTSITIGTDGQAVISYRDATNTSVRLTRCGNALCNASNTSTTIDNNGDDGQDTSIAIGTDGMPIVSYYEAPVAGDLRVTKCADRACSGTTGTALTTGVDLGTTAASFRGLYAATINMGVTGASFSADDQGNVYAGKSLQSGTGLFRNTTDSAAAFQIQNAASTSLFTVDTTNSRLYVGPTAGDTVGAILVLGNKTNTGDPTGVEGAMYYNSNDRNFRCYRAGAWMNCVGGLLSSNTTTSTVSSTTAETNFSLSYSLPANYCTQGRVIRWTAQGVFTTNNTNQTFTMRIKAGTTNLAASPAITIPTAQTNREWRIEGQTICQATLGSSAATETRGVGEFFSTATTVVPAEVVNPAGTTSTVAVNTTTAQTLQISAQPNNTGASITLREFILEGL